MENKDLIVQYSTEKADVLFVMVLDDADFFLIVPNSFFYDTDNEEDIRIEIPDGDWQHLGTLGSFTEEQADLIVVNPTSDGEFETDGIGSLNIITDSLEVYSVNPLERPVDEDGYVLDNIMMKEWQAA